MTKGMQKNLRMLNLDFGYKNTEIAQNIAILSFLQNNFFMPLWKIIIVCCIYRWLIVTILYIFSICSVIYMLAVSPVIVPVEVPLFYSELSQVPPQWHNAVHNSPAFRQRHFLLEHWGCALQPHFKSSLHAFAASGRRVHTGVQELFTLVQPYPSGIGAHCCGVRQVVQRLVW